MEAVTVPDVSGLVAGKEQLVAGKEQRSLPAHLWKPGQSGNPSGRAPVVRKVRELAMLHTEKAIKNLASIMEDSNEPASARVAAAEAILDRAYGKAPQKYEVEVSVFDSLSPEARLALNTICEMLISRQQQQQQSNPALPAPIASA